MFSTLTQGPIRWGEALKETVEEKEFLEAVPIKLLVLVGTVVAIIGLFKK